MVRATQGEAAAPGEYSPDRLRTRRPASTTMIGGASSGRDSFRRQGSMADVMEKGAAVATNLVGSCKKLNPLARLRKVAPKVQQAAAKEKQLRVEVQDPTRGKPLVVLAWLRIRLGHVKAQCKEHFDLKQATNKVDALVGAYNGIDKVDDVVLPLPYCQLLKVFLIAWVFTLPFVLVKELAPRHVPTDGGDPKYFFDQVDGSPFLLPFIMLLVSLAFFGLDQTGAELESPFGTDWNDFPLLHMARGMEDDMNVLLRCFRGTLGIAAPEKEDKKKNAGSCAAQQHYNAIDVTDCEALSSSAG